MSMAVILGYMPEMVLALPTGVLTILRVTGKPDGVVDGQSKDVLQE